MSNPTGKGGFQERKAQINRKGRPRDFTKLRALAKLLGNEQAQATKDGVKVPVIIDDGNDKQHVATQVEMILRDMMHSNPERFLEIGYGKVPQPIEHTGADGGAIQVETLPPSEIAARVAALIAIEKVIIDEKEGEG